MLFHTVKQGAPYQSSHETPPAAAGGSTSSIINAPAQLTLSIEAWLSHLLTLLSVDDQRAFAASKHLRVMPSYVVDGMPLFTLLKGLQCHLEKLSREEGPVLDAQQLEAVDSLDALWQEMRENRTDSICEKDVKERVDAMLRGHKRTRSDRRAAFKKSPHSYRPIGFRGRFVTASEGEDGDVEETHEPQLAALSDEVSTLSSEGSTRSDHSRDFLQDSGDEDFSAASEHSEDGSSDDGGDSEDEVGSQESLEPPLKRDKGNDD